MDKKITRRVVLGTVIGGLAAGPFVIRALKNKAPLESSDATFDLPTDVSSLLQSCPAQKQLFQEWEKYKNLFDVPIVVQKNVKSFAMPFHLPTNYNSTFTSINAEVRDNVEQLREISLGNLIFWGVREGTIQPVASSVGSFLARLSKNIVKRVEFDEKNQAKLESFLCDLDTFSFCQSNDLKLATETRNGLSMWLLDQLYVSLPKNDLKIGDTFEVEMPLFAGIKFPANIAGVVRILGTSAIKITIEKQFNKDDFDSYFQTTGEKLLDSETNIIGNDFRESDFDKDAVGAYKQARANLEKEAQEERNKQPELVHKTVVYLDMQTGLTVRREDVSLLNQQSSFSVFQTS